MHHAIDQGAKFGRMDRHEVADPVREPLTLLAAILGRRKHRAEIEHRAIRILMRLADQLGDQVGRIAGDLAHR